MPRKERSIPPKNANVRIEGLIQEKVEEKILGALKKRECTKTDLYKKIGGFQVNGKELARILAELNEHKLVSFRHAQHCETGHNVVTLWGLYDHPKQVKSRKEKEDWDEIWNRHVEKAVRAHHREEIAKEFKEFIADQAETFMRIAENVVSAVVRTGGRRLFVNSMPADACWCAPRASLR
jgi:hypothetical protein